MFEPVLVQVRKRGAKPLPAQPPADLPRDRLSQAPEAWPALMVWPLEGP